MTCICTNGSTDVMIDFIKHHFEKGAILTLFPMQIIEQKQLSEDFSLIYVTYSNEILQNIMFRFSPEFEVFLKEIPVFNAPEEIYKAEIKFIELIKSKYEEVDNIFRNEIIISLLRVFYLNRYNGIHHELLKDTVKHTRRIEITKMFINLIIQYFNESRDVAFYADKLNITPKYLSLVTSEVRGQSAKKMIDDYIMTEIKLQLNATSKSIMEISDELNFPDPSSFCKFFKRHSGLSPKQFRDK
ncbi:helix-turn-helix domain-containing protein [Saccharicrinis fermentans]|uniref:DNA-binding transcriptional regulator AraC n=1 Tax=Saccharicrinis fermentans DSM 9555 = JCM 21142 TaxID=869213 RepID=W7YE98_9BACT|nr:helix-turn-helix domain-containing protein [Saccharicrinis fermentans]GAF02791.1 DNA-binding transcriptional regulator AraC [Saccharicrinis fermentans DSM 9555 = JCM 21142]